MRGARRVLVVAIIALLVVFLCDFGRYLLEEASFLFWSIGEGPFDLGPASPVVGVRCLATAGVCSLIYWLLRRWS